MSLLRVAIPTLTAATLAAGCTTYSVRRSALVPYATPVMRDGQNLGAKAELTGGLSSAASAAKPREGDSDAGLYIPKVQAHGAARFRVTQNADIGIQFEQGFKSGATSIAPDQPEPEGNMWGTGISLGYSIPTRDPGFRIGLALDLMNYNVPYVEYRTCVDNCGGSQFTSVTRTRENVGGVAFGVVPSYRTGPWTVYGSMTLRSHPTVPRGGVEVGPDTGDELQSGPLNAVAAVGGSYSMPNGLKAGLIVYQPLSSDPVTYSPTLGFTVSVPLGLDSASTGPRRGALEPRLAN